MNNDKFIGVVDFEKKFIKIFEFIASNNNYKAKYIHVIFDLDENCIKHMDYSVNTYSEEIYEKILKNASRIENNSVHEKIWRIDGKIRLEDFCIRKKSIIKKT